MNESCRFTVPIRAKTKRARKKNDRSHFVKTYWTFVVPALSHFHDCRVHVSWTDVPSVCQQLFFNTFLPWIGADITDQPVVRKRGNTAVLEG
jgi:hypothetical protein